VFGKSSERATIDDSYYEYVFVKKMQ